MCIHFNTCLNFSWVSIAGSRIAGSNGNSLLNFEDLPECYPWWLHHFPARMNDPSSFLSILANTCFCLTMANLAVVKWYPIVVLIYTSLMGTSTIKHRLQLGDETES